MVSEPVFGQDLSLLCISDKPEYFFLEPDGHSVYFWMFVAWLFLIVSCEAVLT